MIRTHDDPRAELSRLMAGLLGPGLNEADHARLETLLLEDADALEYYQQVMELHSLLHWAHVAPSEWTAPANPPRPAPLGVVQTLVDRVNRAPVFSLLAAFAFMSLSLTVLALMRMPGRPTGDESQRVHGRVAQGIPFAAPVAHITGKQRVRWSDRTAPPVGLSLRPNERLEWDAGLVEVTFASGAKVAVEGPAKLQLQGKNKAALLRGRLAAHVGSRAARGFAVKTPLADVVDLGTEFGLSVGPASMEVHVFDGAVRVERGDQTQQLQAGEAGRIAAESPAPGLALDRIACAPEKFLRGRATLHRHGSDLYARTVLASEPLVYYRFDESSDDVARDSSGNGHHATLESGASLGEAGLPSKQFPGLEAGNRAAGFLGGRIRAAPPLGSTYTVECWLFNRMPHTEQLVTGYFFSRGVAGDRSLPGEHYAISGTNRLPGRLLVCNGVQHDQVLVGTTELQYTAWQHVVLVRQEDQIAMYLDGALQLQDVLRTSDSPHDYEIFLGCRSDRFMCSLFGRLDEVSLYDRALTPYEISQHYRAARLSTSPPVE